MNGPIPKNESATNQHHAYPQGAFPHPLMLKLLDLEHNLHRFELVEEFEYRVSHQHCEDVIRVPIGFRTDFASVPRPLWSFLPPVGLYAKAAVIHDYLYESKSRSRKEADEIFLEAMVILGVPQWKRTLMFWAVRVFGPRYAHHEETALRQHHIPTFPNKNPDRSHGRGRMCFRREIRKDF